MTRAIGFIGLGNMGGPMAGNLVKAGYVVKGVDPVSAACDAARARGVGIVATAAQALESADVAITMLPAGRDVIAVWSDLATAVKPGMLLIDSSTIDVYSARKVHVRRDCRRGGRHTHIYGRRISGGFCQGRTHSPKHGQAHRPLRRCG